MASINTLIPDVQQLLTTKGWFTDALAREFSLSLSKRLQEQFGLEPRKKGLRLSQIGWPSCPCALWHSVHHPELHEPFQPWAENKFAFGHITEVWALTLAKAAGHTVTGEQDAVYADGIKGHRDCVVDGCIVDVKSAASRSFQEFKSGSFVDNFGYLDQLDSYLLASLGDPLVYVKDRSYLWPIDKQLGHMCLYEHRFKEQNIRSRIVECKRIANLTEPPRCECNTTTEGSSGNIRLEFPSNYNSFKYCCKPGLRTFVYSKGPLHFTKVVKVPTYKGVPLLEVDKYGKVVYN